MFLTLAYLLVDAYNQYQESRRAMRLLSLIRKHLLNTSVVVRRTKCVRPQYVDSHVFTSGGEWSECVLYEEKNKQLLCITPKVILNLEGWVSFLDFQNIPYSSNYSDNSCFVLFETLQASNTEDYLQQSFSVPASKRVKVVDLVEPVAWKSGLPFGIVARCATDNIARLADAFIQGTLCLDDMLELSQMITVKVTGSAASLLESNKSLSKGLSTSSPTGSNSSLHSLYESACEEASQQQQQQKQEHLLAEHQTLTCNHREGHLITDDPYQNIRDRFMPPPSADTKRCFNKPLNDSVQKLLCTYTDSHEPSRNLDIDATIECDDSTDLYEGSNESLASSVADLHEVRGDMDNFAQTVEEVMTLDGEVISEMMDSMAIEGAGEGVGGESLSGPLEELAPETLTPLKRAETLRGKPPNVLVYCGKKDSSRQFDTVKLVFEHCLNRDKYLIYHLKHDLVKSTPWMDNTALLVIASEKAYDGVDQYFLEFFKQNGIVMSFGCMFDELFVKRLQTSTSLGVMPLSVSLPYRHWKELKVISGRHVYKDCDTLQTDVTLRPLARVRTSGYPVIIEANHDLSTGVAILSQALLEKDPVEMAISPEVFTLLKQANSLRLEYLSHLLSQLGLDCNQAECPTYTMAVLLTSSKATKQVFLNGIASRLTNDVLMSKKLSIKFMDSAKNVPSDVTSSCLPLVTDSCSAVGKHSWNHSEYERHLTTASFGRTVIYADVMATTMDVLDVLMFSIPKELSVVAVAGRQTAGTGRGGNAWLSPAGAAMFSIMVRLGLDSNLGQHISILQHIVSLSFIQAVRTLPGYQEIDLRLKWPNDIYFGSKLKLGGILVNTSIMQKNIYANIGMGVNVDNQNPTICVNDIIRHYNKLTGAKLAPLSRELLIARTINWLESLIQMYNSSGHEAFLKLYYKFWLHSDALIRLESSSGPEVKIVGLDDYGYLLVESADGSNMSLHPDGNSFDMMKGLVAPKVK